MIGDVLVYTAMNMLRHAAMVGALIGFVQGL